MYIFISLSLCPYMFMPTSPYDMRLEVLTHTSGVCGAPVRPMYARIRLTDALTCMFAHKTPKFTLNNCDLYASIGKKEGRVQSPRTFSRNVWGHKEKESVGLPSCMSSSQPAPRISRVNELPQVFPLKTEWKNIPLPPVGAPALFFPQRKMTHGKK